MRDNGGAGYAVDPRETMRALPGIIQDLLTRITGKPFAGQQGRASGPWGILCKMLAAWIGGMLASLAIWGGVLPWLLLPVAWMLTICGARTLQVQLVHQCAHFNFTRERWIDQWIGTVLSAVLLVPDFLSYRRIHLQHHAQNVLATFDDDTFQVLFDLVKLRPGAPRAWQWRRLVRSLFSPLYHLRFFARRVRFLVRPTSLPHALIGGAFVLSLVGLAAMTGAWGALLVAWMIPNIILYQMSAALRLCVEHRWPGSAAQSRSPRDYAALTAAVFLGEPCPHTKDGFFRAMPRWGGWFLRMALIHVPSRLCVMVGDTPCHDYHHRHPRDPRWTEYLFRRQSDTENPSPHWDAPYTEIWGLANAIDSAFAALEDDSRRKDISHGTRSQDFDGCRA